MHTLKLRRPAGHTLLLALLLLILLFSVAEVFLRIDPIASVLPNSNFGGRHDQLETQFARLDLVSSREGQVNCFLLGNSLVWLGLDPELFEAAYEDVTEESLHCFNFGVSAMPAAAAAQIADYLVKTYDPVLLIYGVHARDLAVPVTDEESQIIINNPWFQYRKGAITLPNWIKAHSFVFRNLDYLRDLQQFDVRAARYPLGWEYRQLHGFDGKGRTLLDVKMPPDPEDPAQEDGFSRYWEYRIREENIVAVEHIARLNDPERQVIVVVMPVHSNFMNFFRNGRQDYVRFISSLEEATVQATTPFWILDDTVNIPTDGWFDYSHLNLKGAAILSTWLGTEVGSYVRADSYLATDALSPQ